MERFSVADWLWVRYPWLKEAGRIRVRAVACWEAAGAELEAELPCEHYAVQVSIPSFGGSVAGDRYVHPLFLVGSAGVTGRRGLRRRKLLVLSAMRLAQAHAGVAQAAHFAALGHGTSRWLGSPG